MKIWSVLSGKQQFHLFISIITNKNDERCALFKITYPQATGKPLVWMPSAQVDLFLPFTDEHQFCADCGNCAEVLQALGAVTLQQIPERVIWVLSKLVNN